MSKARFAQRFVEHRLPPTDGAAQFCMAEEELHSTKVPRLAIDLSGLRPSHRMGAIGDRFQTDAIDPAMH